MNDRTVRPRPRALVPALLVALALALGATGLAALAGADDADVTAAPVALAAAKPNPVTPGNFTGFGFDQCLAPTQSAMDTWMEHSPFLAVGIYISGNSRACRSQPNLTPAWVRTQLQRGWRLLPITLGPQASCSTRFPRYDDDPKIRPTRGAEGKYPAARQQGRAEATKAVAAAKALGIVERSTLWYDLEAFDRTNRDCRESALAFLSAWTTRLHELHYVSGVYSSADSGIRMLDDVRVQRPSAYKLPDMIWIARWDGEANTSTSYIRDDGWLPGGRMKQYVGGHNETWGGVTINIDRNYLDLGKGSVAPRVPHCGGVNVSFKSYAAIAPGADAPGQVKALQCLLKERGAYEGKVNDRYTAATVAAARAWQRAAGLPVSDTFSARHWVALHAVGGNQVLKFGSAGESVRRLQRALNASGAARVAMSGVYDGRTQVAVRSYQKRLGFRVTGIANTATQVALDKGRIG